MITCNCGSETFKIVERIGKAIIMCDGCGKAILEIDKHNLNMAGFKSGS